MRCRKSPNNPVLQEVSERRELQVDVTPDFGSARPHNAKLANGSTKLDRQESLSVHLSAISCFCLPITLCFRTCTGAKYRGWRCQPTSVARTAQKQRVFRKFHSLRALENGGADV